MSLMERAANGLVEMLWVLLLVGVVVFLVHVVGLVLWVSVEQWRRRLGRRK